MPDGTVVGAKTIQAFWGYGRAAVIESPVDEDQTPGGLIVPHAAADGIERGILLNWRVMPGYDVEGLTQGLVVYYRHGVKIRDVVVVNLDDILAYESETPE